MSKDERNHRELLPMQSGSAERIGVPTYDQPRGAWVGRGFFLLSSVLLFSVLVVAHLRVLNQGADYSGVLLPVDHLFTLFITSCYLGVNVAVGQHLLRRAGFVLPNPIDRLAFSTAVGFGVVATLILGIGFLGGFRPEFLVVLTMGLGLIARKDLLAIPRTLVEIPGASAVLGLETYLRRVAWVVFLIIGLFLLCFSVAPPTDWDSLMYHLEVPAEFLRAGRVFLPPDNLHATFVGLFQILYLPLLAVGSDAGPAVLDALTALMLALVVLRVGDRLFDSRTGTVGVMVFWGTTTLLLVAITPRTDVALAFYVFLGHYALILGLEDTFPHPEGPALGKRPTMEPSGSRGPDAVAWVSLASLILGLGVGVKFNALAYALAVSPVALWVLGRRRLGLVGTLRMVVIWGLIGTVAMAPWLLKNLVLVGAPMYPFLADRIAEPWLDPLFPGGSAAKVVGQGTMRLLRSVQDPFSFRALFVSPSALNVESEGAYYSLNRVFLLLPGWVLFVRNRRLSLLLAPSLAYAVMAITLDVPNVRYLLPAVPALTVAAALIITKIASRLLREPTRTVLVGVVCIVSLGPTARAMLTWTLTVPAAEYALGQMTRAEYLEAHPSTRYFAPVIAHINGTLPTDSRTLMLFEARGYPLKRPIYQDNKISNWPILAAAREVSGDLCLEKADFDFVLLGQAAIRYYESRGLDTRRLRLGDFDAYRRQCLTEVWSTPGYVLFQVRSDTKEKEGGPSADETIRGP